MSNNQPAETDSAQRIEVTSEQPEPFSFLNTSEHCRLLLDGAGEGIWVLDAGLRIAYANERLGEMLGRLPRDLLGCSALELIEDSPAGEFANRLGECRGGGRSQMEWRLRRGDGQDLWVLAGVSPLVDQNGQFRGSIGMLSDITERKHADQNKDEFLAVLGHELRTPLGPIRNAVELLDRMEVSDTRYRRAVETIKRQVRHEARLIDDLLNITRIAHGKISLQRKPVELGGAVRSAVTDHRDTLEQMGLVIEVRIPSTPLWVDADPTRLEQILGNLLANAGKFTEAGGVIVVTATLEEDGAHARLTVADTGEGIEPEQLDVIWEAFSQGKRRRDRNRGGLGLGLALVRGLVELHGGTVRASSPGPGQGCEFSVILPLTVPRESSSPTGGDFGSRPLRVLIIEDNVDAAATLRDLLEFFGHTAAYALTGPGGVAAVQQFQPEVVLCDIGLPGCDGYEVATALRGDPSTASIPLVALTGYGQAKDRQRALAAGFDEHLVKPIEPDRLRRLLAEIGGGTLLASG